MKEQDLGRLRLAIGGITSAVNTLDSLDGSEIDLDGTFAREADTMRNIAEELAGIADEAEEDGEDEDDEEIDDASDCC